MEQRMDNKQPKTMVASFVIEEDLHRQVKVYAASTGKKIKDVLDEALKEYLAKRR